MNASEVKVVRAGEDKPGPRMTSGWVVPYRVISVNRKTGLQHMGEGLKDLVKVKKTAAGETNDKYYCYVLDLSTLPPVEYPA